MAKKMLNIKIEGHPYQVEEGLTIMEAAQKCGYNIPHLCTFEGGRCSRGSCRVCLVEVTGARGLVASCVYPINEGMDIHINSQKALGARRTSVELLLSNHNKNCQQCVKNGNCELLLAAQMTGARDDMYQGEQTENTVDEIAPGITRDTSKCVLCGRCVETCKALQGIGVLGFQK
ncbi:MAG: 2Fe-2S iron-sulfur cluster-binding protein, partial [Bacilli bacterium]|nr:2Fe-2S iron-sulfur cluster-binding protein [Bacilli bacterium]